MHPSGLQGAGSVCSIHRERDMSYFKYMPFERFKDLRGGRIRFT
jgi:hypothetical protein